MYIFHKRMQSLPVEPENPAVSDCSIGQTYQVDVHLSGISKRVELDRTREIFKKNFQMELKQVDYQMNSVMQNYTSKKSKCKKF